MLPSHLIPILTLLLGAVGVWLMLPRGRARGRGLGMVLTAAALGLGASRLPWLGQWTADVVFLVLAAVTVVSAAGGGDVPQSGILRDLVRSIAAGHGGVVSRGRRPVSRGGDRGDLRRGDPGYVPLRAYAGAAQGAGRVRPRELGGADCGGRGGGDGGHSLDCHWRDFCRRRRPAHAAPLVPPTEAALAAGVLDPQHVARFGGELFERHLVAVEIVGTLLLVALVGAAVIVQHKESVD